MLTLMATWELNWPSMFASDWDSRNVPLSLIEGRSWLIWQSPQGAGFVARYGNGPPEKDVTQGSMFDYAHFYDSAT